MDPTTKALIRETVQETIAQFSKAHPCRFTDSEAGNVHALAEALTEEGGNHQTIRIWVQFGRTYQDVTGIMRKGGMILLFGLIAVAAIVYGVVKLAGK